MEEEYLIFTHFEHLLFMDEHLILIGEEEIGRVR